MFQKQKPWRSDKYLNWVKQQPSVVSGMPSDDPHHIKGHGFGGSLRAPDWATIPLTRNEHTDLHNIGWREWEARHGSQLEHVARTLGKAISEGVLVL